MTKAEINKILRKIRKLEPKDNFLHCDIKCSQWQISGYYKALSDVIELLKTIAPPLSNRD